MNKLLIRTLILMLLPAIVSAQAFTNYNIQNSLLPENSVRCIAFESDTVAWVGTDFGLARLANGNMTVFNTANSGISANGIRSLAIDRNKRKWIGTFTNGLCLYNDTSWVNYSTVNSPLPDDFVRSLAIDTAGTKWIGTVGGLSRLDTSGNWTVYTMSNSILGTQSPVSQNIACVYVDTSTNDKWVGTVNGGIILIEKDTNLSKLSTQNSGLSDNTVLGISKDQLGNMVFASPANGLIYKLTPFGWLTFNPLGSSIPTAALTAVSIDGNDDAWVGSFDKGLVYKDGNTFTYFDSTNSPVDDEMIQCVQVANDGKIWFGTQIAGLYILDPALLVSLPERSETTHVIAYPNPVNDHLFIEAPQGYRLYDVIDVQGRTVLSGSLHTGPVIMTGLTPGFYQVRVTGDAKKPLAIKLIHE